jgi:hypothetical protein
LESDRPWINFRFALRPFLICIDSPVPLSAQFSRPISASIAEIFSSKCSIEDLRIDFCPSPAPCSRQFLVDGASSAISRPQRPHDALFDLAITSPLESRDLEDQIRNGRGDAIAVRAKKKSQRLQALRKNEIHPEILAGFLAREAIPHGSIA